MLFLLTKPLINYYVFGEPRVIVNSFDRGYIDRALGGNKKYTYEILSAHCQFAPGARGKHASYLLKMGHNDFNDLIKSTGTLAKEISIEKMNTDARGAFLIVSGLPFDKFIDFIYNKNSKVYTIKDYIHLIKKPIPPALPGVRYIVPLVG